MTGYALNSRSVESVEAETKNKPVSYSESDLSAMTVAQIKILASDLGYSVTKVIKADIIKEFLLQQG